MCFNGASTCHPLKCEGTWRVSSPHVELSLWNLWGQKNIQNPPKKLFTLICYWVLKANYRVIFKWRYLVFYLPKFDSISFAEMQSFVVSLSKTVNDYHIIISPKKNGSCVTYNDIYSQLIKRLLGFCVRVNEVSALWIMFLIPAGTIWKL